MYTATLYLNTSDFMVFSKNISYISEINYIVPTSSVNTLTPVLILDYNSDVFTANYIYIPFFGRYYYIISADLIQGKKIQIQCKCDVLMSFHDSLLNSDINVARAETPQNKDTPDDKLPISPKQFFIETNLFPNNPYSIGGNQYVLGVNGTETISNERGENND